MHFPIIVAELGHSRALPQEPRCCCLISSAPAAPELPGQGNVAVMGLDGQIQLTFDPGDFGIPRQSHVKTAIAAEKGKGQGLNHYPGFCAQEMARGEAQADGRITFPLSRAVSGANSCLG